MASSSTISPKIIVVLVIPVILLVALVAALYFIPTPIPGTMDIKVQKLDNSTLETTSLKGRVLVVEFMATWCDFCVETSQNFAKILTTNNFPNVVFLSVSIDPTHDTPSVLTNFINSNNFTDYAINGSQWFFTRDTSEQYTNYGVGTIPHSFLINTDSKIVAQHLGLLTTNMISDWLTNKTPSAMNSINTNSVATNLIRHNQSFSIVTKTV